LTKRQYISNEGIALQPPLNILRFEAENRREF
jgi:hypothetical protein